ncbi:AAA family ATPase [Aureimonas leprariae]|nr:AAA family ATPase [Aureimonas leprariae]
MTVFSLGKQAARVAGKKRQLPPRHLSPSAFVARGMIVHALRQANLHHVLCHEPCTVGIAGVSEGAVDAVSSAARDIMGANLTANYGFDVSIYDRTDVSSNGKRNLKTLVREAAKGGERAAFLFPSRDAVPGAFLATAEGVVDFGPVDRRVLRGAFMAIVGRAPDRQGLDLVASLPIDLLDSVVVKGRGVERSLGVARRLLAAVAAEAEPAGPPAANPPTASSGPRLEELSGLGEVGEWGAELVRDIADYRAGAIPWTDVDRGVLVTGPPGVGKTMFAAALGRSCGVPVHLHSFAAWQARGHLGDLLKAMRQAFDEARKSAPSIPSPRGRRAAISATCSRP